MADLFTNFPSWGETGEYPADGFFYEGGDQVNEKHMDALWNGLDVHFSRLIEGVEERTWKVEGDTILDGGLAASQGTDTREVDVTASTAGAFVDGQYTGATNATTLTHSANGGTSTRTDAVWVNTSGTVGKTEGTTSVTDDRHKIAEVDVATDDTISAVRNYGHDTAYHFASENFDPGQVPGGVRPGNLWLDLSQSRMKVRQNGGWRTLVTEQDDVTISGGDGLKGGGTFDPIGGYTATLNIEPADFAGHGLEDDGADNLRIDGAALGDGLNGGDGTNLSVDVTDLLGTGITESTNDLVLDESVIKDGGAKQIDAAEFAGGQGTSGQVLTTDGTALSWETVNDTRTDVSNDGSLIVSDATDINFGDQITATSDGDGSVTVSNDIGWSEDPNSPLSVSSGTSGSITLSKAYDEVLVIVEETRNVSGSNGAEPSIQFDGKTSSDYAVLNVSGQTSGGIPSIPLQTSSSLDAGSEISGRLYITGRWSHRPMMDANLASSDNSFANTTDMGQYRGTSTSPLDSIQFTASQAHDVTWRVFGRTE